jgi:hypothetical protein
MQVRDPLERLGAGPSESAHSMDSLRAHPFFASIHWDTLWDDPAPPLETGLVRREPAPVDEWDDVGATWDELVRGPDGCEDEDEEDGSVEGPHPHGNAHTHARLRAPGDDGIEWAPDAQAFLSPPAIPPEEIGPHGEMPDYAREALALAEAVDPAVDVNGGVEHSVAAGADGSVVGSFGMHFTLPRIDGVSDAPTTGAGQGGDPSVGPGSSPGPGPDPGPGKDKDAERGSPASTSTGTGEAEKESATSELSRARAPLPVPRSMRDSYATSSSDGSPVEKLGAALEAMGIHRGRLRTRSPTPARGAPASVETPDWYVPPCFWFHFRFNVLTLPAMRLWQGIRFRRWRDDALPRAGRGDGAEAAHVAAAAAIASHAAQAKVARARADEPQAPVSQAAQVWARRRHQGRIYAAGGAAGASSARRSGETQQGRRGPRDGNWDRAEGRKGVCHTYCACFFFLVRWRS